MEFKVRCMYSEEDVYACVRARRCRNKAVYIFSGVWLVMRYVGMVVLAIASLVARAHSQSPSFIVLHRDGTPDKYSKYSDYINDVGESHYTFRETDILLNYAKGNVRMEYSTIQDIVESPDYFFLFVNTKNAYILPKRDFTRSDPAAFGPFIAEKCGKEIIQIK